MSEFLGISYLRIAAAAIIPAILYYGALFVNVHIRARRRGLKGLDRSELPRVGEVFRRDGHLLIPLAVIITMLLQKYTPLAAAYWGIISVVVVSMFRAHTRLGIREILAALDEGARGLSAWPSPAPRGICGGHVVPHVPGAHHLEQHHRRGGGTAFAHPDARHGGLPRAGNGASHHRQLHRHEHHHRSRADQTRCPAPGGPTSSCSTSASWRISRLPSASPPSPERALPVRPTRTGLTRRAWSSCLPVALHVHLHAYDSSPAARADRLAILVVASLLGVVALAAGGRDGCSAISEYPPGLSQFWRGSRPFSPER
jgi:hypothetical protein